MLRKEKLCVISFPSTTMALKMEKKAYACQKEGRIIPLPKEIDAGCGLAWASRNFDQNMWKDFLVQQEIVYDKITEVTI